MTYELDYVKSCHGGQPAKPVSKYRTNVRMPLTGLFGTVSIEFAGPLPESKSRCEGVVIAAEHLNGWPMDRVTID